MKVSLQFFIKYTILFSSLHLFCLAHISNSRKCADKLCTVIISKGRTTQRYSAPEISILSFHIDENVDIYSKEAGNNTSLWGVEISGNPKRRGYIPKKLIVELQVFVKEDQLTFIVPTIPADHKSNKNREALAPENESKSTTTDPKHDLNEVLISASAVEYSGIKGFHGKEIENGKVIDHKIELPSNNPDLDKNENINESLDELHPNNNLGAVIEGNRDSTNTNANSQDEGSVKIDQKQGEFPLDNTGNGHEFVQKISDFIPEEIPFENQSQNNETVNSEEIIVSKTEVFNDQASVNLKTISNKILDVSSDDSIVGSQIDYALPQEEASIANNIVDDGDNIEDNNNDETVKSDEVIVSKTSDILSEEFNDPTSKKIRSVSSNILEESSDSVVGSKIDYALPQEKVSTANDIADDGDNIEDDDDDDDEEMDNEDEGNGNEGEENGKEMDIRHNTDIDESYNNLLDAKEIPEDLSHSMDIATTLEEELTAAVSDIIPISLTSNNSNSDSLPEPTPSRNYEVFEGTTVFVEDVNENSEDPELSSKPPVDTIPSLNLQASQIVDEKQDSLATPYYETTVIPIVTSEGFTNLNKEKINQLDFLPISDEMTVEKQEPSLSSDIENINKESIADLQKEIVEKQSNAIDNEINVNDGSLVSSEIINDYVSESLPNEEGFVMPKPESILKEFDKPSVEVETEDKGFISFLYNNVGASQDNTVETDIYEEHLSEVPKEEDKTESADFLFSDPYKEVPVTTIDDKTINSELPLDDPLQQINLKEQSEDSSIEAESADKTRSLAEDILDISHNLVSEEFALAIEDEIANPHLSSRSMVLLIILAITIVTLHVAHTIIIKTSREAPLLVAMNNLDKKQRLFIEENNNLKRMLSTSSNGQIKSAGSNVYDHIEFVRLKNELSITKSNLEQELEHLKEHNLQLEKDLEISTANEEELNRMISELLSSQNETQSFEESVNFLQTILDDQKEKVESLTADLAHKTRLNDELRAELKSTKDRSLKLEHQIEHLAQSLDEMKSSKQDALKRLSEEENNVMTLKDINNSIRQEADVIRKESDEHEASAHRLQETVKNLQQKLASKTAECKVSKECFKSLQLSSDGGNNIKDKLAEIFKIVEVKTKLEISENERLESEAQLSKEVEEHELVSKFMTDLQQQSDELQEKLCQMETERNDATSKLNILTHIYEEKVSQLKRELESQEELRQDAEGSAADISNRVQSFKIELQSYKDQIGDLKQELDKQKQSYKIQLANEEKKFSDTWLNARNAERRQEELRQENTLLRQKLTHMQKEIDQNLHLKNPIKRAETNGSLSSPVPLENDFDEIHSPPTSLPMDYDGPLPTHPMFLPPMPPHMHPGHPPPPPHPSFLPPFLSHLPPHPPLPDRRLPPAGRIASPPGFDRSYSPSSDYSDHRYSPSPRYSPGGGNRNRSPDRRSDRSRHSNVNMRRKDQASPDRWYSRSPQRFKQRHSPPRFFNHNDNINESKETLLHTGKKTSTPIGPNDR